MFRSHFTCEVRKPTCFRSWHDNWNWKETQMLGTTWLPDYNIFTCAIREDELLLKWFIRHTRRLPGRPFYRRLLPTRQMKTALETTSRAATNTSKIASDIIESFQWPVFRFSQSPNHLIWLSWGSATHFHNNHSFNHSSCSLMNSSAEPSLVLFQSVLVSSSLRLCRGLLQHF